MRLTLAAIFCSALLSGLLNMKRFALEGDAGRGTLWECGGRGGRLISYPPALLQNPGEDRSLFLHQYLSTQVLWTSRRYHPGVVMVS